jgi:hypothetical protein
VLEGLPPDRWGEHFGCVEGKRAESVEGARSGKRSNARIREKPDETPNVPSLRGVEANWRGAEREGLEIGERNVEAGNRRTVMMVMQVGGRDQFFLTWDSSRWEA